MYYAALVEPTRSCRAEIQLEESRNERMIQKWRRNKKSRKSTVESQYAHITRWAVGIVACGVEPPHSHRCDRSRRLRYTGEGKSTLRLELPVRLCTQRGLLCLTNLAGSSVRGVNDTGQSCPCAARVKAKGRPNRGTVRKRSTFASRTVEGLCSPAPKIRDARPGRPPTLSCPPGRRAKSAARRRPL